MTILSYETIFGPTFKAILEKLLELFFAKPTISGQIGLFSVKFLFLFFFVDIDKNEVFQPKIGQFLKFLVENLRINRNHLNTLNDQFPGQLDRFGGKDGLF